MLLTGRCVMACAVVGYWRNSDMDNIERMQLYRLIHRGPDEPTTWSAAKKLTPAQRRRLRHKENSPKTHSHDSREVVELADGKVRLVPCWRCSPVSKKGLNQVGGS